MKITRFKISFCILLLCAIYLPQKLSAVSYRGFVEGGVGIQIHNKQNRGLMIDIPINTTHGIQLIKNLYAGVGIGLNIIAGYSDHREFYDNEEYVYNFNQHLRGRIYGDLRWDGFGLFGSGKRVTPFVDLKIGYQSPLNGFGKRNGMFLTPSLGVRIGFSSKVGINIGLYCDAINYVNYKNMRMRTIGYYNVKEIITDFKWNINPFGLVLGVDF